VKTASSGSSQTSKDTLRQLPPLEGPKVLPDAGNKDKGKGQKQKGHSVGHWILLHHTPKILVKPDCKSSLLWWHPTEHAIWSRGWRSRLKNRKEEDEQWQAFSSIFSMCLNGSSCVVNIPQLNKGSDSREHNVCV